MLTDFGNKLELEVGGRNIGLYKGVLIDAVAPGVRAASGPRGGGVVRRKLRAIS
jgi:hypothetical protein